MQQLKIKDVVVFIKALQKAGMTNDEIYELPIYLGDDDELNGVHCAWFTNLVDSNEPEDGSLVEMINEDSYSIKFEGKAILIS